MSSRLPHDGILDFPAPGGIAYRGQIELFLRQAYIKQAPQTKGKIALAPALGCNLHGALDLRHGERDVTALDAFVGRLGRPPYS